MINKKQILLIFIVGTIVNVIGAFYKIQHWEKADLLLLVGLTVQVAAVLIFLFKVYVARKSKK